MNWKLIVVGGVVFYAVMFVISIPSGIFVHGPEGMLNDVYRANESFWRPELNQNPPDMAALMPVWIATGLVTTLIMTAIYGCLRPGLGRGWVAGAKYGLLLSVLAACFMAGWSGLFNLPYKLWIVWAVEMTFYYVPGGAALGWVAEKVAPQD